MLPLVTGTAKLVARAMAADCKLVIIDTTGSVSGVAGQLQKFSKMDLAPPDIVIAFSRGGELEPILGHTRRFTTAEVIELEVPEAVDTRSVEERTTYRERQFAAYFQAGLSRWRIKPQVFMPSLPPEFDLALLDGIVVGMEDGKGSCVGIGVLENGGARDTLKMVSPVTEGVKGLRLGSIRISTNGRSRGPVNLRNLFQTE
jgi:polynucleotide 5'-kinase involved in rRNA processing